MQQHSLSRKELILSLHEYTEVLSFGMAAAKCPHVERAKRSAPICMNVGKSLSFDISAAPCY